MFEHFRLARYRITIRAGEKGLFLPPYKGATFRGGFGQVFRRIVCSTREKECLGCVLRKKCSYPYIFETAPPENTQALSKYENVPRPFIFEPPLEKKREYAPGESLHFQIILVGDSIQYLPYFIVAFREMGEAGLGRDRRPFILSDIEAIALDKTCSIYSSRTNTVKNIDYSYSGAELSREFLHECSKIQVQFVTPVQLKDAGKFATCPTFHVFFRQVMRRVSALSYFHHGRHLEADYAGLAERARRVSLVENKTFQQSWERYSRRQQQRMKIGGLLGGVVYEGDLSEFLPWLAIGEHIHAGKNAVFGLGKYRMKVL